MFATVSVLFAYNGQADSIGGVGHMPIKLTYHTRVQNTFAMQYSFAEALPLYIFPFPDSPFPHSFSLPVQLS